MNHPNLSPLMRAGRLAYRLMGASRADLLSCGHNADALSLQGGNDYIANVINAGNPWMIARLGFVEANAVLNHLEIKKSSDYRTFSRLDACFRGLRHSWDDNLIKMLSLNAGFFPCTEESAGRFCELYISRYALADAVGFFGSVPGEIYLHKEYNPTASSFPVESLEPYRFANPWSSALGGKKVLVVHPFAESIKKQYERRRLLFENGAVLPEFELKVLPAVQSIAGNACGFGSWFDALAWMEDKMEEIEFDVCLVGAGAYGLPLAAHAKGLGKISIHMGGATQVLFGIRGMRWEKYNKDVGVLFNEHWIRPDDSERPQGAHEIEEGCYW